MSPERRTGWEAALDELARRLSLREHSRRPYPNCSTCTYDGDDSARLEHRVHSALRELRQYGEWWEVPQK